MRSFSHLKYRLSFCFLLNKTMTNERSQHVPLRLGSKGKPLANYLSCNADLHISIFGQVLAKYIPHHFAHAIRIGRQRLKEFEHLRMKDFDDRREDTKPNCEWKLKFPGFNVVERICIGTYCAYCFTEGNCCDKIESKELCPARELHWSVFFIG